MNTYRLTTRGKKMIAVAVAGVTIGVGGALVAAAGSPSDGSRTIDPTLIEYATEHQLTGQSPASLHAATVRDSGGHGGCTPIWTTLRGIRPRERPDRAVARQPAAPDLPTLTSQPWPPNPDLPTLVLAAELSLGAE